MVTTDMASEGREGLYPDEVLVRGAGIPAIARFRRGHRAMPLIVLVPGGGNLGRIFYGHDGANPHDFLQHWLEAAGFPTLALSYPCNHPAFGSQRLPALSVAQWAEAIADIAAAFAARHCLTPELLAVCWSLGGRVANRLMEASRRRGLKLNGLIGLAATAPLPGLGTMVASDITLSADGLWNSAAKDGPVAASRRIELDLVDRLNGRPVLDLETYLAHYVVDTPLNLRGEAIRYDDGQLVEDMGAAVADQRFFDYANNPLTAVITGLDQQDGRHTLADPATWSYLNAHALYFRHVHASLAAGRIDHARWDRTRQIIATLPERLSRTVDGGHFFFVGAHGAKATASHIYDLYRAIDAITAELGGQAVSKWGPLHHHERETE